MSNEKTLKAIRSGLLSRGSSVSGILLGASRRWIEFRLKNGSASTGEKLLLDQVKQLTETFGELKGGLMKLGQMLSVYGENLLPPEINEILKPLQSQSPPVAWEEMKEVLEKEWTAEMLASVEIEAKPMAAASIGQVYRAFYKPEKIWVALKIQYPKAQEAIANDLKILRSVLSLAEIFPNIPQFDLLYEEIRDMLLQEIDYHRERDYNLEFSQKVAGDPRFLIPKVVPELTTHRVIATRLEEGLAIDSPEVANWPLARRNDLARKVLEFYMLELFEWGLVQTDPHFGNFRIRASDQGDSLILYDFGACRRFTADFIVTYRNLIRATIEKDMPRFWDSAFRIGFLEFEDPVGLKDSFFEFCRLMIEPFRPEVGVYNFGASDLPKRMAPKVTEVLKNYKLRVPPKDVIFLDRKTTGVFVILSKLGAEFPAHEVLTRFLNPTQVKR